MRVTKKQKEACIEMFIELIGERNSADIIYNIVEAAKQYPKKSISSLISLGYKNWEYSVRKKLDKMGIPKGILCDTCNSNCTVYMSNDMWMCEICDSITQN